MPPFRISSAKIKYLLQNGAYEFKTEYVRAVGGTTWHWTGITPRFLPIDFEIATRYGVGRDWPIRYADLEPYYLRAEGELGVSGDSEDDHGSPRSGPYPMPPLPMPYSDKVIARRLAPLGIGVRVLPAARGIQEYDGRPACCGNNNCSPICPIGAQYCASVHVDKAERAGARLRTNAVAFDIETGADRRITAVRYKDPAGQAHRVEGRYAVVACHGIETPKLLLMSRSHNAPNGIGNSSDQVGRNLMSHPQVGVRFLMPEPLYAGRGPTIVSELVYARDGEFRQDWAAAKVMIVNLLDVHGVAVSVIERDQDWRRVDQRLRDYAIHAGYLMAELEPLPEPSNRVRLSPNELDALGLPKPVAEFALSEYVKLGERRLQRFFAKLMNYLGARQVISVELDELWSNHIVGTTIMGGDPRNSVVDRDCRSHGHPNLFIAGSSVFSSSSTANPTLTIAALSLRLAHHLKRQMVKDGQ